MNTRLDAAIIAFQLDHANTKVLITDREFSKLMKDALAQAKVKPIIIDYDDPEFPQSGDPLSSGGLRAFIAKGDPNFAWRMPTTSGRRSRSTIRPARRAIPRALSITTAVLL